MKSQREYLGPAVVDGQVRFFSVSALEKADTRNAGCLRAWFYRYVLRIKDESSPESKKAGTQLHAEIADFQTTGNRALSALALSGLHMVPPPGLYLWCTVR